MALKKTPQQIRREELLQQRVDILKQRRKAQFMEEAMNAGCPTVEFAEFFWNRYEELSERIGSHAHLLGLERI